MDFTAKHLKSLLQGDLVTELEKVKANIIDKIKQFPKFSQIKSMLIQVAEPKPQSSQ